MRKAVIGIISATLLSAAGFWGANSISEGKVYQISSKLSGDYFGWWGTKQDARLREVASNSLFIGFIAGFGTCGLIWLVNLNAGDRDRSSRHILGEQYRNNSKEQLEIEIEQLRDKVNQAS